MPHITQGTGHTAVRHRINAVAVGIPLVPSFGHQRHFFTIGSANAVGWSDHLGLLKLPCADAFHDWVSQRAQFVAHVIVVAVLHERVTVQLALVPRRPFQAWGLEFSRPNQEGLLPSTVGERHSVLGTGETELRCCLPSHQV